MTRFATPAAGHHRLLKCVGSNSGSLVNLFSLNLMECNVVSQRFLYLAFFLLSTQSLAAQTVRWTPFEDASDKANEVPTPFNDTDPE